MWRHKRKVNAVPFLWTPTLWTFSDRSANNSWILNAGPWSLFSCICMAQHYPGIMSENVRSSDWASTLNLRSAFSSLLLFLFSPSPDHKYLYSFCLFMMGPDWGKEKDKREEKNRKVRPDERVHKDCTQCTASRPLPVNHLPDQGLREAVNFWCTSTKIHEIAGAHSQKLSPWFLFSLLP